MMRQRLHSILFAALFAVAVTPISASYMQQLPEEPPFRVRDIFNKPGYLEVKIVGVCNINVERADCWDTAGRRYAELSNTISAHYRDSKYSQLRVRPGVKNRWVVIERETSESKSNIHFSAGTGGGGGVMNSSFRPGYTLEWVRLDNLKEDETTELMTTFRRYFPEVVLEVKEGARANVGGLKVTLEKYGRKKAAQIWDANLGWGENLDFALRVQCQVIKNLDQHFTTVVAIDKMGQPVKWADKVGKPVAEADVRLPGVKSVQFLTRWTIPTEVEFITNVDPSFLSQLKISHRQEEQVIFQNIPLDPGPASRGSQ